MPTDEPWAAEIREVYESIHEITPHDDATFRDAQYSEERLREAFEDGWLSRKEGGYALRVDPNNTYTDDEGRLRHRADLERLYDPDKHLTPEERRQKREEYFEMLAYLGYDPDDFDYHAWREWMDYNGE